MTEPLNTTALTRRAILTGIPASAIGPGALLGTAFIKTEIEALYAKCRELHGPKDAARAALDEAEATFEKIKPDLPPEMKWTDSSRELMTAWKDGQSASAAHYDRDGSFRTIWSPPTVKWARIWAGTGVVEFEQLPFGMQREPNLDPERVDLFKERLVEQSRALVAGLDRHAAETEAIRESLNIPALAEASDRAYVAFTDPEGEMMYSPAANLRDLGLKAHHLLQDDDHIEADGYIDALLEDIVRLAGIEGAPNA